MADRQNDQEAKHFKFTQVRTPQYNLLYVLFLVAALVLCACGETAEPEEKELRNSNAYADALASLSRGEPVLIVLLDGFGYMQYEQALADDCAPYLASLPPAQVARTYYPPISPVGLAAMVTGEGPEKNGIRERGDMNLLVKDVFSEAAEKGRTSVLIEGDIKLINTSCEPLLHVDVDGDFLTDSEVFATALYEIEMGTDLIFVHFHGIDDRAHEFGPMSPEAMERVTALDAYLAEFAARFSGDIIITADHGLHETTPAEAEGDDMPSIGTHGADIPEDMLVPYIYLTVE